MEEERSIAQAPPTEGSQCTHLAYRISIEGLEVEAFISYANMARVGHQRKDHLRDTLHVRLLSYTLKASQQVRCMF